MASVKCCVKICVLLIFFVYLIGRTESSEYGIVLVEKLNYSEETLNTIAAEICNFFTAYDDPTCLANWLGPPVLLGQPSELNITHRGDEVQYEISQSDFLQAVTVVSDDESHVVQHLLMPPASERVWLNATLNYTFWTAAVVENGTHSTWLQGPKLLARNNTHKSQPMINYTINIDKDYSQMLSCNCSTVTFTWKIHNESDTFFRVTHDCMIDLNNDHYEEAIACKPNDTEVKYSKTVTLGSKCYFKVEGYGKGGLLYEIEPQAVKNITSLAFANGDGWDIRVNWAEPEHTPDRYRVELLVGEEEYKQNVSGRATEATFYGVMDDGFDEYVVSVCVFKGPICMHESVWFLFPRKSHLLSSSSDIAFLNQELWSLDEWEGSGIDVSNKSIATS